MRKTPFEKDVLAMSERAVEIVNEPIGLSHATSKIT